jgi:dipeptidase D
VSGGLGGHSGSNIAQGRSNAVKVLGRALRDANREASCRLVSIDGGRSRNAIPRDARAVVSVPVEAIDVFRDGVDTAAAEIRDEFAKTDAGLTVTVADADPAEDAWSAEDSAALLDLIAVVPAGPLTMSPDFAGLTETSTSLGEVITDGERLTLHSLTRSANDAALSDVISSLDAAAGLAGGTLEVKHNHPGWRPNLESAVLATALRVFRREFGREAEITGVHAGLEPAVIGGKVDGLDMLAIGPEIRDPHSPDERVSIPSVERFWRLLAGLVSELSEPQQR